MTRERSELSNDHSSKKPIFSKRHYEFIADVLRDLEAVSRPQDVVVKFTKALARDNPKFDADRFHDWVDK